MRLLRLASVLVVVAGFVGVSVTLRGGDVSAVGNPIDGSGTTGRIAKYTANQCIGDSVLREDGSGNVGIGATNPAARFLVQGGRLAVNGTEGGNTGILVANQNGPGPIATFSTSNGTDIKLSIGNDGSISISGVEVIDSSGRFVGGGVQKFNPNQVAILRWYEANESGLTFAAGDEPSGVAFDGANIWVVHTQDHTVSKIRVSDGMTLGTFPVGGFFPVFLAFDGASIWVTSTNNDSVTKFRASDGMTLGTFRVDSPTGVAFDGANIWVANSDENRVTKLRQ